MKTILILIVVTISVYLFSKTSASEQFKKASLEVYTRQTEKPNEKSTIRIVFLQDVTGSIRKNGVELISSSMFTPVFAITSHPIIIDFGCISSHSCAKLVTIRLPTFTFRSPNIPDLHNISLLKKKELNEEYKRKLDQYNMDSSKYTATRMAAISEFSRGVDSVIAAFTNHLTTRTDLATAIEVADRVFNTPLSVPTKNILIANTDGQDTYGQSIEKLRNKALVIVTNVGRTRRTSMTKITSLTLTSPAEAIEFVTSKYLK